MKKIAALILVLSTVFVLCGCGHEHIWKDATCTEPKTCSECGATEGEALGHSWKDATCTEPKTCSECGATEGEALGHKWEDATCTKPKTCSVCGATEGKALGHKAGEATCTEPAICSVCGETVKNALGHKWEDATCTKPKTCAVCGVTEGKALGHKWKDATVMNPKTCEVCGKTEGEPLVLFYWNEPVDLGSGYTACFYDDGDGNYRFEVSNPNWSSATIYMMLENNVFSDYGIGASMFRWMKHVMEDCRDFYQQGKMVYYTLNGAGGNNMFYFNYGDIDAEKNGIVGLKLNSKSSMEALYYGTIGQK